MGTHIRINQTPAGGYTLKMRQALVGCVIPLPSRRAAGAQSNSGNGDDQQPTDSVYSVLRTDVVVALRELGKDTAARYWSRAWGKFLLITADVCEEID